MSVWTVHLQHTHPRTHRVCSLSAPARRYRSQTVLYILMEYAPGGSLSSLVRPRRGLDDSNATLFYSANLLLALKHLHERSIVHRDIKPANILIGANGYLKVCGIRHYARSSYCCCCCFCCCYDETQL